MKQLGGRYWAGCESGHKASGLGQGWAIISSFSFLDFCTQGFASCIILNAALSSCTRSHLLLNSIIWHTFSCTVAELGTRQYCRNNETVFSGHKVVCYCNITLFGVAPPSRHRDLNIFRIFSGPCCSITLSRCRCREAIQFSRAQLC